MRPKPPDGGWGWVVVAAGFVTNLLSMGLYRSGGIIYVASLHVFQTSRSIAAWIPMVTMTIVFFMAPFATYLAQKFSFRLVVFVGGTISSLGVLLCFFATDIKYLFLGWSVVFAIGSGLVFFPTIALVGVYFKKRRALAMGLVLTGGAVGAFTFPPLLEYLIREYGLRGATLIVAGLVMHYCSCALVLRLPYSPTQKKKTKFTELKALPELKKELLVRPPEGEQADIKNELLLRPLDEKQADQVYVFEKEMLEEEKDLSFCRSFSRRIFSELMDIYVIINRTYLINCASNGIHTSIFLGVVTILPDFGVDQLDVSAAEAAYFVSASAIADLSTRFLSGWMVARLGCRLSVLYGILLLLNGCVLLCLPYVPSYALVMLAAVLLGSFFASGMILYFEILGSCQTPEKYPMAFGLSEMMKAPFVLAAASTVGSLRDATGSYSTTFLIFCCMLGGAAAMWLPEILEKPKSDKKENTTESVA